MPHYKLVRYNFGDYEKEIASGNDEDMIAEHAIVISSLDAPYTYTYRLEAWVGNRHIGGWRFFSNGREFTQDIRNACSKNIQKGKTQ